MSDEKTKCKKCSKEVLSGESNYCSNCGQKISEQELSGSKKILYILDNKIGAYSSLILAINTVLIILLSAGMLFNITTKFQNDRFIRGGVKVVKNLDQKLDNINESIKDLEDIAGSCEDY